MQLLKSKKMQALPDDLTKVRQALTAVLQSMAANPSFLSTCPNSPSVSLQKSTPHGGKFWKGGIPTAWCCNGDAKHRRTGQQFWICPDAPGAIRRRSSWIGRSPRSTRDTCLSWSHFENHHTNRARGVYHGYSSIRFPFSQSIELTKPVPKGGHHFYWKAEIENAGLIIRTWLGDNSGAPFDGYAVRINCKLRVSGQESYPGDVA